jgi:CRP/FNR family transcriptional regulator
MSRDEIGNYLGLAAETVSRTLSRLQQDGLIKVDGRKIEILGIAALKAISGPCILSGQPYS